MWGREPYGDTIEQLFGYLTWRHTVGVLVAFSRNKGLTNVVERADEAIKAHPSYRGGFAAKAPTYRVSEHEHPADERKTVAFHHLFFDLYPRERI